MDFSSCYFYAVNNSCISVIIFSIKFLIIFSSINTSLLIYVNRLYKLIQYTYIFFINNYKKKKIFCLYAVLTYKFYVELVGARLQKKSTDSTLKAFQRQFIAHGTHNIPSPYDRQKVRKTPSLRDVGQLSSLLAPKPAGFKLE